MDFKSVQNTQIYISTINRWIIKMIIITILMAFFVSFVFLYTNPITFAGARILNLNENLELINWDVCIGTWDCYWSQLCSSFSNPNISYVAFRPDMFFPGNCSINEVTQLIPRLDPPSKIKFNEIYLLFEHTFRILQIEGGWLFCLILIHLVCYWYPNPRMIIVCSLFLLCLSCISNSLLIVLFIRIIEFVNLVISNTHDFLPIMISTILKTCIYWINIGLLLIFFSQIYDTCLQIFILRSEYNKKQSSNDPLLSVQ